MKEINKISLPCLRGKMGDWMYYVTLLSFEEVSKRIKLPKEIDKKYANRDEMKLGEWIQRELAPKRTIEIVEYLKNQDQRFFNSLILGMYDGKPEWSELNVKSNDIYTDEVMLDSFSRTFGVLTLSGKESVFAIDGQHRAISIRKALKNNPDLKNDEICTIFVAHKTNELGKIRTRRLFSTLNRYAKPVNKKEIIVLSEDDNCAILTRRIVENYKKFKDRILIHGNKSINRKNKESFTTIIQLYDIIVLLKCSIRITGVGVTSGLDKKEFTNTRVSDVKLDKHYLSLIKIFDKTIDTFKELGDLVQNNDEVNRSNHSLSLIFRPIGQEIFFKVLKVGMTYDKSGSVFNYFSEAKFNLNNKVWNTVFWDKEANTIITTLERQKYAYHLIMEKIGLPIKRTKKDLEVYESFGFNKDEI